VLHAVFFFSSHFKSKAGGGCSSGGSSGKSRSGGGKGKAIHKSKQMQSTKAGADQIVYLRGAIYDENGNDRDLLAPLAAFTSLRLAATETAEEEQLTISFATGKSAPRKFLKQMFGVSKSTMEEVYDASGYGWDDDDKRSELKDSSTRHLLVCTAADELVGFASFQLTLQGEMYEKPIGKAIVFVREFQVVEKYQRRGIGRHVSRLLEMIGMKHNMSYVEYLVTNENFVAQQFISTKLKGYVTDGRDDLLEQLDGYDEEEEGYAIFSKVVSRELKMAAKLAAKAEKENAKLAKQLAAAMKDGLDVSKAIAGVEKTPEKKTIKEATNNTESPSSVLDSVTKQ
jgi:predicted acetyltransferase